MSWCRTAATGVNGRCWIGSSSRFVTDNSAEEQAYRTGQVQVIAPIGRSSRADLRTFPNTNFSITPGNNFEVLMFNTAQPPLDDKAVRQALAYATDRSAIAKTVFSLAAQYEPLDSFLSPVNPYYVTPFRRYQRNLQKVDDIMQADGWSRGPDGIWTRQGQRAVLDFTTTDPFPPGTRRDRREHAQGPVAGSRIRRHRQTEPERRLLRRHPTERQVLNRQLLRGEANRSRLPTASTGAPRTSPRPGWRQTFRAFASQTLDDLFHKIAGELDDTRRKALVAQAQEVLADEVPGLPFASTPTVIYWRTSVRGPIGPNEPLGPFMNLNQWSCAGGQCSIL